MMMALLTTAGGWRGAIRAVAVSVILAQGTGSARAAESAGASGSYVHPRFGIALSFPADVFAAQDLADPEDGQIWLSRDGSARLLVGAIVNDERARIADYREQVMQESYPGARFDYMPLKGDWFVLSGRLGDAHFYQRVTFRCAGRLISSWAITYPEAARATFDRIVERVAGSFDPGGANADECP